MLPNLDQWLDHFEQNANAEGSINWESSERLTAAEYNCVKSSVAAFQLGEYSEGRGLIKFAKEYAAKHNAQNLIAITRYFVKEEQNHALMLKRFMSQQGIPVVKKNWTDSIFRRLRKNAGYELSITVLITAEMIALIYYRALMQCTQSRQLKTICQKILVDETAHVKYESSLLNYIRSQHPVRCRVVVKLCHRLLFLGTVLVVYREHHKVISSGGFSFLHYWHSCWKQFRVCFAPTMPHATNLPRRVAS